MFAFIGLPSITPRRTDCRAVFTVRVLAELNESGGESTRLGLVPKKTDCKDTACLGFKAGQAFQRLIAGLYSLLGFLLIE